MKINITLFTLFIIVLFTSCNTENNDEAILANSAEENTNICNYQISQEQLKNTAEKAIRILEHNNKTKGTSRKISNIKVINQIATKSTEQTPLLYIVNFANETGYTIVSADKRTPDILAILEEGSFKDPSSEEDVFFLEQFKKIQEKNLIEADKKTDSLLSKTFPKTRGPIYATGENTITEYVWHITQEYAFAPLDTKWGDGAPFNSQLPTLSDGQKALAGSGITAIAQIMYYHNYPSTFKWKAMKGFDNNNSNIPETQKNALAELYKHIADNTDPQYGNASVPNSSLHFTTTITSEKVNSYLISQGYKTSGRIVPNSDVIIQSLQDYAPVIMYAEHNSSSYPNAPKMWIIDGVCMAKGYIYVKANTPGSSPMQLDYGTNILYHCNMGNLGIKNGYYTHDIFNLTQPDIVDNNEDQATTPMNPNTNTFYKGFEIIAPILE